MGACTGRSADRFLLPDFVSYPVTAVGMLGILAERRCVNTRKPPIIPDLPGSSIYIFSVRQLFVQRPARTRGKETPCGFSRASLVRWPGPLSPLLSSSRDSNRCLAPLSYLSNNSGSSLEPQSLRSATVHRSIYMTAACTMVALSAAVTSLFHSTQHSPRRSPLEG